MQLDSVERYLNWFEYKEAVLREKMVPLKPEELYPNNPKKPTSTLESAVSGRCPDDGRAAGDAATLGNGASMANLSFCDFDVAG